MNREIPESLSRFKFRRAFSELGTNARLYYSGVLENLEKTAKSSHQEKTPMVRMIGLKKMGKFLVALAAGGICLNPLSSQQLPGRIGSVQQAARGSGRAQAPDK